MENNKMEFNIESPFSFDLGDEIFPLPDLPPIDIPAATHDQLPLENKNNNNKKKLKNGSRRNPLPSTSIIDENLNEHKKKKIIHRDVERQRRQDMSSLYSTLRSLLPFEYLKGNRSVCDHVHETVKYIQHMENQIQHLSKRRDELKMLSSKNGVSSIVETLNSSIGDSVVVRARNESKGVQVIVDTSTQNMNLVSNILQALGAEGLEILNYNSAKVNERFLHTIECHVVVKADNNYQSIDVSELQHKLMNLDYRHFD